VWLKRRAPAEGGERTLRYAQRSFSSLGATTQLPIQLHKDSDDPLLLWPDAEQLTLDQSVGRLQKLYPDYPHELIEDSALGWLEMGYTPENYSVAQMDILDKQTAQWVKDHLCPSKKPKKP